MPSYPATPVPEYPLDETPTAPEILITTHRDGSEQRRFKSAGKLTAFRLNYGKTCPLTFTEVNAILTHYAAQTGALDAFSFVHPERGTETYVCRYSDQNPPKYTDVGHNAYQLVVELQVVPA